MPCLVFIAFDILQKFRIPLIEQGCMMQMPCSSGVYYCSSISCLCQLVSVVQGGLFCIQKDIIVLDIGVSFVLPVFDSLSQSHSTFPVLALLGPSRHGIQCHCPMEGFHNPNEHGWSILDKLVAILHGSIRCLFNIEKQQQFSLHQMHKGRRHLIGSFEILGTKDLAFQQAYILWLASIGSRGKQIGHCLPKGLHHHSLRSL
mmetsp:Transcript_42222/g.102032  ORF Transcript_42222/g.102032 Transcript_42222/m.102032 type:complete len:202 (+) Transcript_42222:126-731(+)